KVLGIARMSFHDVNHPIAITDVPLEQEMARSAASAREIAIDNFSFAPHDTVVPVGAAVMWTNRDDVPHNIVSTTRHFRSPVIDTDGQFTHQFEKPGAYEYYCSLHPKMTGRVVVG
ncbi:MAG TPA: plastocyanin/azurin family copper-binding protein, partial [Vicinamibacterales bacterium]|nr:plastocyanin/azurin family copper-binding protein [Vicinamibacterales bacterium]